MKFSYFKYLLINIIWYFLGFKIDFLFLCNITVIANVNENIFIFKTQNRFKKSYKFESYSKLEEIGKS